MKHKKTAVVITVAVALVLLVLPTFFAWVLLSFMMNDFSFLALVIGAMLVVVSGCVAYWAVYKRWTLGMPLAVAVIVVCLAAILGNEYYRNTYLPSITIENRMQYADYAPFQSSETLAHLDKESSLRLTDNLPVLDGATALLPVYCSFAEAVYPKDTRTWVGEYTREQQTSEGQVPPKTVVCYSGTKGAYEALIKGERDIIFVAMPSKEQKQAARDAGVELNLTPIGYEAFVFLVNAKNPVDTLSTEQIKSIYTGNITNWQQVGGKNLPIRAFQRDTDSGSQTAFLHVMGEDAKLIPPESEQVFGMDGMVDVVSDYQNHKNAIGYSFRYYVQAMLSNTKVKLLAVDGISPTEAHIADHTYPLADTFFAVTVKGRETEHTKRFVAWMLSEQGQELIAKAGYVPLR